MSEIISEWIKHLKSYMHSLIENENLIKLLKEIRSEVALNSEIQNRSELSELANELSTLFATEQEDIYQLSLQTFCNLITGSPNLQQTIFESVFLNAKNLQLFSQNFLKNSMVTTVTLVMILNFIKNSQQRCKNLYETSHGIEFIDFVTNYHVQLNEDQSAILEIIVDKLIENGLLQYSFDNLYCQERFPLLTDFQYKILEAASVYPNSDLFIPAQLIMLNQYDSLIKHIEEYFNSSLKSDSQSKVLHHNISLWLQFYFHHTQQSQLFRNTIVGGNIIESLARLLDFCHKTFPQITRLSESNLMAKSIDYSQFPDIKKNVIQILNNLMEGDRDIPNQLRELGAVPILLSCCNIDDNHPYIREHAIFAVKNLTHENIKNQTYIEKLTPIKAAPSPVLNELGLESSLDADGKVKIRKLDSN